MTNEALILCEGLVKIYHIEREGGGMLEIQALQGLDLTVAPGELMSIVGASGSGKSTLLNLLGGLDTPTAGRLWVAHHDLARMSARLLDKYRRDTVGFVWQQGARNLIPYLTARENVQLPLTLSGEAGKPAHQRAEQLLDTVGLGERAGHRLDELSGGEQQRVAIAIALSNRPRLLLADEPTGELDTATAATIYSLFRQLNHQFGLTIVIVSHDPGIARHVDRVVAVRDGRLATETLRIPGKTAPAQAMEGEHHHHEHFQELVVLDGAGRLQIPREALEHFKISRRARLEVTEEGILIRPAPEAEKLSHASHHKGAVHGDGEPGDLEQPETESAAQEGAIIPNARRAMATLSSLLKRLRRMTGLFHRGKSSTNHEAEE